MSFRRRWGAALGLLFCTLITVSAPAIAQEEDHAQGRGLAVEGFKAYKESDYETALAAFEKARSLYPAGQVLRMWGYTLVALERWVEAVTALEGALKADLKPLNDEARRDVAENLEKALSHTARVSLESEAPGAFVIIDGGEREPLPITNRILLEGAHRFTVEAPGFLSQTRAVDLRGGSAPDFTFELERTALKPQDDSGSGLPKGFWQTMGLGSSVLGLTSLGAGVATLLSGRAESNAVDDRNRLLLSEWSTLCSGAGTSGCLRTAQQNHRDGQRAYQLETAGVTMMAVGGVLVAGGVTAYVLGAPPKTQQVIGWPRCVPGALSVQCAWRF